MQRLAYERSERKLLKKKPRYLHRAGPRRTAWPLHSRLPVNGAEAAIRADGLIWIGRVCCARIA